MPAVARITYRTMPKAPPEDLATFVRRQPADDLAAVLLELSDTIEPVRERLERMQLSSRPDKLAASFRKQLFGWKRARRFLAYREAREFGRTVEAWLEQVARELQPRDPAAALALFEDFIETDAAWFERADDSDGVIGTAVREACRHWLEAAAQCEAPASAWPERLLRLYDADQYSAREPLLRYAERLLDETALREIADHYQAKIHAAVAGPHDGPGLPHEVFRLSGRTGDARRGSARPRRPCPRRARLQRAAQRDAKGAFRASVSGCRQAS